jgi:acrylyl-CoA reductase (NADPH)
MPLPEKVRCYLVHRDESGQATAGIETLPLENLPEGDVLIDVQYSSLNYKDALAATGNTGVARKFPHVPGIDAAGVVLESSSAEFNVDDEVVVTGYELGSGAWGGWCEAIRVPADWVVPLPDGLTSEEAMILGTAGFTAAQCVDALQHQGVHPDSGPVVVTGATGGVGSLAVSILAKLGYEVTAITGKAEQHAWLKQLGAAHVAGRDAVDDASDRALLRANWAGAVDTVGGNTLATLLRSTDYRGCVTACGLVGGADLNLTVYPFLLRGVRLIGIDSAHCPMDVRLQIWQQLAGPWKLDALTQLATHLQLEDVTDAVQQILAGQMSGRYVVDVKK